MCYAVFIPCSLVSLLTRRGQKDTDLRIPRVAQLGFEAQGYQPSSESKNDQSKSNFAMSGWLLSWCHPEPPPVWHYCWENWLKLNYEPQGEVWTTFKTHLKTAFSVIAYAFPFFSAISYYLHTHFSEHTRIFITENMYCFL